MDTFRIPGHSRCSKFKISRDVAVVPRIPEEDENDGDVCCSLFLILLYCESVQSTIVVDTMEHELQCVMRNPSAEALSKFSSRMADVGPWTVAMAEICARGLQQKPSGTPALLYLLATTSWPDHVVYAISQPLELLTDVVVCQTNDQQRKRSLALVAVVRMWEALERMRSHTSPLSHDTLWLYSHICPSKLNQMANVAVEILTRYEDVYVRLCAQALFSSNALSSLKFLTSKLACIASVRITIVFQQTGCCRLIQKWCKKHVCHFFRCYCDTASRTGLMTS